MSLIPGAVIDQVIPENDSLWQNTAPRVRQKTNKQTSNQKQQQTQRQIHKTPNHEKPWRASLILLTDSISKLKKKKKTPIEQTLTPV